MHIYCEICDKNLKKPSWSSHLRSKKHLSGGALSKADMMKMRNERAKADNKARKMGESLKATRDKYYEQDKQKTAYELRKQQIEKQQLDDDLNDQKLLQDIDMDNIDRSKVNQIKNSKYRSRLQHEGNIKDYRKFVDEVNKPSSGDMLVEGLLNFGVKSIPKVGQITDALGVSIGTDPNKRLKDHFNKQYSDLMDQIEGGGLGTTLLKGFNWVADKLIKREFNNTSQATINQYGNYPVVGLRLMRTPIMKVLNVVLNAISLGKWSELKKKYNFDDMYHLALVATVQIGSGQKDVVMEKNAQINISTSFGVNSKTEQLDIPLNGKKLTVNVILNNGITKVGKEKFFLYDPLTNNCQYFCSYLLQGIGLYNFNTRNFLYQNIEGIKNELSEGTKQTMMASTNLSALVGQITGAGLTVHAVKIHKRMSVEEQLKYVEFLSKSWKDVHVKELNNSFKFELKPRKKIKKGTLKTVKIDGDVAVIVGELNE